MIDGYVRVVSGWLGVDPNDIRIAMRERSRTLIVETDPDHGDTTTFASLGTDVGTQRERDVIVAMLRYPEHLGLGRAGDVLACYFANPALARIRTAMVGAFGEFASPGWISSVVELAGDDLRPLVSELAMVDIPVRRVSITPPKNESDDSKAARVAEEERRTGVEIQAYVHDVALALIEADIVRQRNDLQSLLQRSDSTAAEQADIQQRISDLEIRRRKVRGG